MWLSWIDVHLIERVRSGFGSMHLCCLGGFFRHELTRVLTFVSIRGIFYK